MHSVASDVVSIHTHTMGTHSGVAEPSRGCEYTHTQWAHTMGWRSHLGVLSMHILMRWSHTGVGSICTLRWWSHPGVVSKHTLRWWSHPGVVRLCTLRWWSHPGVRSAHILRWWSHPGAVSIYGNAYWGGARAHSGAVNILHTEVMEPSMRGMLRWLAIYSVVAVVGVVGSRRYIQKQPYQNSMLSLLSVVWNQSSIHMS